MKLEILKKGVELKEKMENILKELNTVKAFREKTAIVKMSSEHYYGQIAIKDDSIKQGILDIIEVDLRQKLKEARKALNDLK